MWYTEAEIIYDVEHAANPYEQVGILAELNGVSRKEVEKVLKEHGIALPKYQRRSGFYGDRIKEKKRLSEADLEEKRRREREWYHKNRERIAEKRRERGIKSRGEKRKKEVCAGTL